MINSLKSLALLKSVLYLFVKVTFAATFIYAGIYKLADKSAFISSISSYPIINQYSTLLSYIIPSIEILLGIMVLSYSLDRYAALALSVLLVTFIALMIVNNLLGISRDCGCFPPSFFLSSKNPIFLLLRNTLLLAFSLYVMTNSNHSQSRPLFKRCKAYLILSFASFIAISFISLIPYYKQVNIIRTSYALSDMHDKSAILNSYIGKHLPRFILKDNSGNTTSSEELIKSYYLLLILNSLECGPCKDEAAYFEYLANKYKAEFDFCAVVRPIGRTAIMNYMKENGLSYKFFENFNSTVFSQGVLSASSAIVAVSPDKTILLATPATHNLRTIQHDFEAKLTIQISNKAHKRGS